MLGLSNNARCGGIGCPAQVVEVVVWVLREHQRQHELIEGQGCGCGQDDIHPLIPDEQCDCLSPGFLKIRGKWTQLESQRLLEWEAQPPRTKCLQALDVQPY